MTERLTLSLFKMTIIQKKKKMIIISVVKDVEELRLSHIAGWNVKG